MKPNDRSHATLGNSGEQSARLDGGIEAISPIKEPWATHRWDPALYLLGMGLTAWGMAISSYSLSTVGLSVWIWALYRVHRWIRKRKRNGSGWRLLSLWSLLYPLGGICIGVGISVDSSIWAFIGTALGAVGLADLAAALRELTKDREDGKPHTDVERSKQVVLVGAPVAFAAAALSSITAGDEIVVLIFMVGLVGLLAVNIGLMRLALANERRGAIAGGVAVGGAVLAFNWWYQTSSSVWILGVIVSVLGFGLVGLSKALPKLTAARGDVVRWVYLFAGIAVAAAATATFSSSEWPAWWTLVVVALALVLAMALVGNVIELAAFVIVGVLLAVVVADRTVDGPASPHPDGEQRIVALGDSYIAGEGAERFFADTNTVGENECRRSSTSYPYLVADALQMDLQHLACSGARTGDIDLHGQMSECALDPDSTSCNGSGSAPAALGTGDALAAAGAERGETSPEPSVCAPVGAATEDGKRRSSTPGELPQLCYIDDNDKPIAAALLSIGGNDAWFGRVGQACFSPGSCSVHRTTVLSNVAAIQFDLERVYKAVLGEIDRTTTPIIVMPYPMGMTSHGCDASPLTDEEHEFLFEYAEVLNDLARTLAERHGIHFFEEGIAAFDGYRVCEMPLESAAINVVHINPKQGRLSDRVSPLNWTHGSAHPNALGHELTAMALEDWLREHLDALELNAEKDPNPPPDPSATFELVQPSFPKPVSTRTLPIPESIGCPVDDLPAITLNRVVNLGGTRNFSDAIPGSPFCYNSPSGAWVEGIATEGGVASVPLWGRDLIEANEETEGISQVVITNVDDRGGPPGDERDDESAWRVTAFTFCELDRTCAEDDDAIQTWMYSQITEVGKAAAVPVLFIFVGAWAVAFEWRRRSLTPKTSPKL